jgi:hypothetical protein
MNRLFIFGIGGTGSRVCESLAFLLASGVSCGGYEVVPILIDTDASNKDTLDCVAVLEHYERLHDRAFPHGPVSSPQLTADNRGARFFATPLRRLSSIAEASTKDISTTFRLNFQSVVNLPFRDFIALDLIQSERTKSLLEVLYSEDNLNDVLTGGFLGNPNVGSVVLSAFRSSPDFALFATSFRPGDRIFIISSIFGGTGAAGLPWLLKTLRSESQDSGAAQAIRKAPIGALTVMPYFGLRDDDQSRIDSNAFITKTKAALAYYADHVQEINAQYYIADSVQNTYSNHESGSAQNNDAHLIELLGALAVTNFANRPDREFTEGNRMFFECAIGLDSDQLSFDTVGAPLAEVFEDELTRFHLLAILCRDHFGHATHQPWAKKNGFAKGFFAENVDWEDLKNFVDRYLNGWLRELAQNRRAFTPFDLQVSSLDLTRFRNGRLLASRSMFEPAFGGEAFDVAANTVSRNRKLPGQRGDLVRFFYLTWLGTEHMRSQYSAGRGTERS